MTGAADATVEARKRFRVLRSKNAGPYFLTLDMVFREAQDFERAAAALKPADVASAYGVPEAAVTALSSLASLRAIKISLLRRIPAGHPGCSDCYGMNQEEPLARLLLRLLDSNK
jgi:hypothetical protein